MAGWATKIDKTLTSFEETTGKIQDAMAWCEKARDYAHEYDAGCAAYVDMYKAHAALEALKGLVEEASNKLARDMFGDA